MSTSTLAAPSQPVLALEDSPLSAPRNAPREVTRSSIRTALDALAGTLVDVVALDDAALLGLQSQLGAVSREVSRHAAVAAGELARRSSRDRGYAGLAQSTGHRTPEALLQAVTDVTAPEARRLVAVGSLPVDSPLAAAVSGGTVSVDAADAIRRGLGTADDRTSSQTLDTAAEGLLAAAETLTPEQLYREAADTRGRIDLEAVAEREAARRELRYARVRQRDDGMVAGSFLLDQEDGQLLLSAMHTLLSPRRGGPRFVSEQEWAATADLISDPRSDDQLAADALADIIRLAVDADTGTVFGEHRPGVQVVVTAAELASGIGSALIEGAPEPITIDSAQRRACADGLLGVLFSELGQPLDVGRAQRLFTSRQRIALAVRDGGCRFPGCERPPSCCEAHHVKHWHRDHGPTDVENGILLCRHHHLLVHNNGWELHRGGADHDGADRDGADRDGADRDGTKFWITPPRTVDPQRRPRRMPCKSRILRRLATPDPTPIPAG